MSIHRRAGGLLLGLLTLFVGTTAMAGAGQSHPDVAKLRQERTNHREMVAFVRALKTSPMARMNVFRNRTMLTSKDRSDLKVIVEHARKLNRNVVLFNDGPEGGLGLGQTAQVFVTRRGNIKLWTREYDEQAGISLPAVRGVGSFDEPKTVAEIRRDLAGVADRIRSGKSVDSFTLR